MLSNENVKKKGAIKIIGRLRGTGSLLDSVTSHVRDGEPRKTEHSDRDPEPK
jgi:hypothetical protein